jgi:hypothetical protein
MEVKKILRGFLASFWAEKSTAENMERKVWHKKPLSVFLLYAFLILLAFWNAHSPFPSPGEAVAALAVAAAVMTLFGEMKGKEKLAWMLILFGFLYLELSSVDIERTAQEEIQNEARAEQLRHFGEIGNGIRGAIERSQRQFDATMSGINKNINAVTGGSSFCFVVASPIGNEFLLNINTIGGSPLHETGIEFIDNDLMRTVVAEKPSLTRDEIAKYTKTFPPIPFLVSSNGQMLGTLPIGTSDKRNFSLIFFAMNGNWHEILKLRRVNGQWEQAIKVAKMLSPIRGKLRTKILYTYATDKFPQKKRQSRLG